MDGFEIFPAIVNKLDTVEPRVGPPSLAAVSVIMNGRKSPKILLIERAERKGDPWSGQIAFPGGRAQGADRDARDTAVRETLEEVGVDLDASSRFLGYFRSFRTHTGAMQVVPSVFLLTREVRVTTNEEVSSFRWINLERFLSPEAESVYRLGSGDGTVDMPAFRVDDYLVWGLTHRIIANLLESHPTLDPATRPRRAW